MVGKIPQPIKLEVIKKWLKGYWRDQIAKDTEIGAGTVTGIIRQCRQDDPYFDLLRGVALELKEQGMRVEHFAPLFSLTLTGRKGSAIRSAIQCKCLL
jgi:hypothetical protein